MIAFGLRAAAPRGNPRRNLIAGARVVKVLERHIGDAHGEQYWRKHHAQTCTSKTLSAHVARVHLLRVQATHPCASEEKRKGWIQNAWQSENDPTGFCGSKFIPGSTSGYAWLIPVLCTRRGGPCRDPSWRAEVRHGPVQDVWHRQRRHMHQHQH